MINVFIAYICTFSLVYIVYKGFIIYLFSEGWKLNIKFDPVFHVTPKGVLYCIMFMLTDDKLL